MSISPIPGRTTAPIPAATMLGYSAEGARTNVLTWSNDLSNAIWNKPGPISVAQNEIGIDGAISAWTLTDDNAGVDENVNQPSVRTAETWTDSCYFKKTIGAQSSYPVFYVFDGATRVALCTVDTTNGVATVWTAYTGLTVQPSVARCRSYNSTKWFVELSFTATAATWTTTVDAAGTTNATQSSGVLSAATTGSCVVERFQAELGSFASSYIPTTTIAVTRNADVLTYSSAGNISGTAGWAYAELSTYWTSVQAGGSQALGTGSVSVGPFLNSATGLSTGVRIFDGTNVADDTSTLDMYRTPRKRAARWGSDIAVCADGGAVVTGTFDGSMGSVLYIGCAGDTTQQWQGTIRNVRIGQRQLSASELLAITS